MRLAHEFGLWARPGVTVTALARATDAELELVHDPGYIAAVRTVSGWAEDLGARGLGETHLRYARTFRLGTGDNPVFPGMHQASALAAGATLAAARAVWPGPARRGHRGRHASRDGRAYQRVRRLQRRRGRDRLAAGRTCSPKPQASRSTRWRRPRPVAGVCRAAHRPAHPSR
jgi:Histone deacetylase domain